MLHLSREIRLVFTCPGSLNRIAIYIINGLLVQASIPTHTLSIWSDSEWNTWAWQHSAIPPTLTQYPPLIQLRAIYTNISFLILVLTVHGVHYYPCIYVIFFLRGCNLKTLCCMRHHVSYKCTSRSWWLFLTILEVNFFKLQLRAAWVMTFGTVFRKKTYPTDL